MVGYHEPVLLKGVIDALEVGAGSWYIDATLGDGGHSLEILKLDGNVVGIDVDPKALERVRERFNLEKISQDRYTLVRGNFRELNNLISQAEPGKRFKGVLFDLGVSSLQLEDPERGFSFGKEGPLDMRMDPSLIVSAADLIKVLRKDELDELFSKLGEEKRSRSMASAMDSARQIRTERSSNLAFRLRRNVGGRLQGTGISTTVQLAQIIEKAAGGRRDKIHPATKVFQALRIAVNDELNALREVLPQALKLIEKNGHVLVISFHSLEDRIVKNTFNEWEDRTLGRVVTKKPMVPSEEEIDENPRSRSAKLRVFVKN